MQAVILTAGLGLRIRSITNSIPKCLIEVNGKKIISHQIDALKENGIHDIIVVVGYLQDKIKKFLGSKVSYVENPIFQESNSSYSLWLALKSVGGDFIYLNGDLLFDKKILKKLVESPFENAIIVDKKEAKGHDDMFKAHMIGSQIIELNKKLSRDKIIAAAPGPVKFSKKGKENLFQRLDELINSGDKNQWCYSVFSRIAREINLQGIDTEGLTWIEVDTPEDLEIAESMKIE